MSQPGLTGGPPRSLQKSARTIPGQGRVHAISFMAATAWAWCIGVVKRVTTVPIFLVAAFLVGCGSRTSLDARAHGGVGDGGAPPTATVSGVSASSTGTGPAEDPCLHPVGRTTVATLPPGPIPDSPSTSMIRAATVLGDTLYFANFWSLYAVPKCGGQVVLLHENPQGGFFPEVSSYPFGMIEAMAVGSSGIYWWANGGLDLPNDHLWHTALDGSFTVDVPTTFASPAIVGGPAGTVFLVDPAIRRINADDTIDYLGSAAPLDFVSLPAFDGSRVYFSAAIQQPFGPLFSIPLGGGDLQASDFQPWLREITGEGAPFYGIRAGDPSAIVEVQPDGTQSVLADGLSWDTEELHVLGDELVFRSCEATWSLDRHGGTPVVEDGAPDCYPLDPDEEPIQERAPRVRRMATDAGAFYVFEGDQVVRVRLE